MDRTPAAAATAAAPPATAPSVPLLEHARLFLPATDVPYVVTSDDRWAFYVPTLETLIGADNLRQIVRRSLSKNHICRIDGSKGLYLSVDGVINLLQNHNKSQRGKALATAVESYANSHSYQADRRVFLQDRYPAPPGSKSSKRAKDEESGDEDSGGGAGDAASPRAQPAKKTKRAVRPQVVTDCRGSTPPPGMSRAAVAFRDVCIRIEAYGRKCAAVTSMPLLTDKEIGDMIFKALDSFSCEEVARIDETVTGWLDTNGLSKVYQHLPWHRLLITGPESRR